MKRGDAVVNGRMRRISVFVLTVATLLSAACAKVIATDLTSEEVTVRLVQVEHEGFAPTGAVVGYTIGRNIGNAIGGGMGTAYGTLGMLAGGVMAADCIGVFASTSHQERHPVPDAWCRSMPDRTYRVTEHWRTKHYANGDIHNEVWWTCNGKPCSFQ